MVISLSGQLLNSCSAVAQRLLSGCSVVAQHLLSACFSAVAQYLLLSTKYKEGME